MITFEETEIRAKIIKAGSSGPPDDDRILENRGTLFFRNI
jgi:hypothetical protein